MKKLLKNVKAGFVFRSLLWSVLLYGCATCIVNWNELTNKNSQTIVYSNTDNSLSTVHVSIDSLRKQISTADYILRYLYVTLR